MATEINQLYLAMIIGFGLAMGVAIFISVLKLGSSLIGWLVERSMGYKNFSYSSTPSKRVKLDGRKYIVNSVVSNVSGSHTVHYLTGIGPNNPDVVITVKNKGA
ncbi:hypothetical protein Presley_53 [Acinetobacter phage Presley]|uniref:Uncharacterized protein n=1 Tax=Acinetobacter phage Presley TaxID=1406780 RepID=U5PVV3_9CAUD|nr:hypothetical protein Presley_53 [Acinetobacter phage Presley]AGY48120.1 hypothetical protein Presley_53 [Acinetobacter phage Presley]